MTGLELRRLPAVSPAWDMRTDVVVVGAGAAGISAALAAAAGGRDVVLLCKGALGSGATSWAQGGLAAAIGPDDSTEVHVSDTLRAGAGLCDQAAVRALVAAAPVEVRHLQAMGAQFDVVRDVGGRELLALTREGGHSRDRVLHAGGDASGAEVDRALTAALRSSPVTVLEYVAALDAVLDAKGTVVGIMAARIGADGFLVPGLIHAPAVVLATGGLGQAWRTTTNPTGATGDGLALALRSGAEVRDMEFVQFHPTVLHLGASARGQQLLVTEALRGEGAVLVDATGRRVMQGHHAAGDLAPRDVVAAAITTRLAERAGGVDTHVFLDATALGREVLEHRFPTVLAGCRRAGIDPVGQPIPVAPGAHYSCGGVRADLWGRTSVPGLFAVGEVASTGVHGANRLASNSITEALVAGRRVGQQLAAALPRGGPPQLLPAGSGVAAQSRRDSSEQTSTHVGVVRSGAGLQELLDRLGLAPDGGTGREMQLADVEALALHTVSTVVAAASLHREESRGCLRRSDVSGPRREWARHVTWRLDGHELVLASGRAEAAA